MYLDRGKNGAFVLTVPRGAADVPAIIRDHGWDFSETASRAGEAVLFTRDKYAALAFADYAAPDVLGEFGPMMAAVEASWAVGSDRHVDVPPDKELWAYQRAGVDYCLAREHALLADAPGCGKTAQAICIANEIQAKRVLVVCPASIRSQWRDAIRAWTTLRTPIIYPIMASKDGAHPRAHYTVVSYDLCRSAEVVAALKRQRYDLLILDEAHFLKTHSAKRTARILGDNGLMTAASKVVALTGTAMPNRPREVWTLASALCPGAIDGMTEEAFCFRYNPMQRMRTQSGKVWTRESVGRLPELQNRLRVNFMVRRLKAQVLPQLPDVRYEIVHIEETGPVLRALQAERLLDIDPERLAGVDATVLGQISSVRQEMGIAKAPQVAAYVRTLLDGGEDKLLVFTWHTAVTDLLRQELDNKGVVWMDGRVAPVRRRDVIARFQADPNIRVLIGNLQTIGTGTDGLQNCCAHAIFAECSWVGGENEQGVSRLERIGQKTAIMAEFLVAPGSFDEKILGSALRKMRNVHAALDENGKEIA